MKTKTNKVFRYLLLLLITSSSAAFSFAQTAVFADPALGSFDITDLGDNSVDANTLSLNGTYKLKLDVFNLALSGMIPSNTAFVDVNLGTKFILDPFFNLSTAPLNNYFTFTYSTNGSQAKIRCVVTNTIPADFNGKFSFNIKGAVLGTSTVTSNFSVANNNPAFTLSDVSSGNNTANLQYTITNVLPVLITDFKAENRDCNIYASWSAQQETNSAKYDVEVSKDGVSFFKAGTAAAENKAAYAVSFPVTDLMRSELLYVRLKSVDLDGQYKYSPIITTGGNCETAVKPEVYCFPNPLGNEPRITLASKGQTFKGTYRVSVVDAAGKQYFSKSVDLDKRSSYNLIFDNQLSAGNYFIYLKSNERNTSDTIPFIKY